MMLIYVTRLIIIMLFQNRPAGDQRGPCRRFGAREHSVGDSCSEDSYCSLESKNTLIHKIGSIVRLPRDDDVIQM